MHKIIIYTDGACEKSPRVGGWGWTALTFNSTMNKKLGLIEWNDHGGIDSTTNQQMELTAMAEALDFCIPGSDIEIWSDSAYVIGGITGAIEKEKNAIRSNLIEMNRYPQGWMNGWKSVKSFLGAKFNDTYWNTDRTNGYEWYRIHQRVLFLSKHGTILKFGWVKGHAGIEGNEKADKLAALYKYGL